MASGLSRRAPDWVNRVPMRWANKGDTAVDLGPGGRDRLDLFRVRHHDPVLEWVTPSRDAGVRLAYGPGEYRVVVAVAWDGDREERRCLRVKVGSTVNDVAVFMIPLEVCGES